MKTLLASTALASLIALPVAAQTADTTLPADGAAVLAVYDLNEDGVIDMADLELADTNGDGVVDANDAPQMAATDSAPLAPEAEAGAETDMAAGTEGTLAPEADVDAEADVDVAAGSDGTLAPEADLDVDADAEIAAGSEGTLVPETGAEAGVDTDVAVGSDATLDDSPMVAGEAELAADITGERVYDANDEWIGEVSEIVVADGKSWAIIDVGGFLGIGEKPVAMDISELDIVRDSEDADDVRVSVAKTKEELEAMPTYEKM